MDEQSPTVHKDNPSWGATREKVHKEPPGEVFSMLLMVAGFAVIWGGVLVVTAKLFLRTLAK